MLLFKKKQKEENIFNNLGTLKIPGQIPALQKMVNNVKVPDYDKEYKHNYNVFYTRFHSDTANNIKWRTTMAENCSYITNIDRFMYADTLSGIISAMNDVICSMISYIVKNYHTKGYCYDFNWQEFTDIVYGAYNRNESVILIAMRIWKYFYPIYEDLLAWQDEPESPETTAKYAYDFAEKILVPYYKSLDRMSPLSHEERIATEEVACHREDILLYTEYIQEMFTDHDTAITYIKKMYWNRATMGFEAYEYAVDKEWHARESLVPMPGWMTW